MSFINEKVQPEGPVSYTHLDVYKRQAVARRTVARLRVVRAAKLRDVAFCILDDLFASDQVGVAPVSYTHLGGRDVG